MAIPDGGPLSSFGRKKGYSNMKRIAGPDVMEKIFRLSERKGYTHYFYGSSEKTLKKLENNLMSSYPDLKIIGMYSPPFNEDVQRIDDELFESINLRNLIFFG